MGKLRALGRNRTNSLGACLLLAGLGYFLLAFTNLYFKINDGIMAPVWPSNALALALILVSPRGWRTSLIVLSAAANLTANYFGGTPAVLAPYYSLANGLEIAIAAWGLQRSDDGSQTFLQPKAMPRILLWAGLVAPAASACFAGIMAWLHYPLPFSYIRWFLADALGLLIFTPIFVSLLNGEWRLRWTRMDSRRRLELIALLALVTATSVLAFSSSNDLLLFIVIVPMMLVALRGGWLATTVTFAIVAVTAGGAMSFGYGPPALQDSMSVLHIYGIQAFIVVLMVVQVPISATLAERQAMIDRLRESEQSLHLLAAGSPLLLLAFDLDGRCSRAMGTNDPLLARPPKAMVGEYLADLCEEGQYELQRAFNAALDDVGTNHSAEYRTVKRRDAWLEVVFRAHFDETGRCSGAIATVHDITMRKNQEISLSRTATTDDLTGLLNRAGFRERLDHALIHAEPGKLSLAVIDIDRFKLINDNSGHQVGDLVLREIACRVSAQVRSSDAVGRIGGDEFVILLATSNWERVQDICNRIVCAVNSEPIALPSNHSLPAAISCGVACYKAGQSADEFIHEADTALYKAKRGGRNQVVAA